MITKILLYFKEDTNIKSLIKYGEVIEKKTGAIIEGIYIKDIRKFEVIPPVIEGLVIDSSINFAMQEWEKVEKEISNKVESEFKKAFANSVINITEGIGNEIIAEKMKAVDLVVTSKTSFLSQETKSLLRTHYKPLILVPEIMEFSMDNIVFAYDNEQNSNKSFFNYKNLFNLNNNLEIIIVNNENSIQDIKDYLNVSKINYKILEKKGDELEAIVEVCKGKDMLIMGDLKHFFMIERLTGKLGVKILENIEIPIFIG